MNIVEHWSSGVPSAAVTGRGLSTAAGSNFVEQLETAVKQAAAKPATSAAATAPATASASGAGTTPTWRDFLVGKNASGYYDGLSVTPTADVPSGYKAGPFRHQLEGFNAAKFDPSHPESMTAKMISARIFEQFDVIHNKRYLEGDTSKGMAWTWLKVGEGWKTGTTPSPTETTGVIPPMNNPYIPSGGSGAIDLRQVTWLHENVGSWPVTSSLDASVGNGKIKLNHTKAGDWPVLNGSGDSADVEGNAWVFVNRGGRWYGATWEWLKPGQTSKTMSAGDLGGHIKKEPLKSWAPQPGECVGFMVSTPARDSRRTSNERSNIAMTTWPG